MYSINRIKDRNFQNRYLITCYILIIFFISLGGCSNTSKKIVSFGIFTDSHFCLCEARGDRFYENSIHKIDHCMDVFNDLDLDFIINLGDIIDQDYNSLGPVIKLLGNATVPVYHVLGNADYNIKDSCKQEFQSKLGIKNSYYSFSFENWLFIVLNGNDLSYYSVSEEDTIKFAEVDSLYKKINSDGYIQAKDWNGGIGKDQMDWLRKKLWYAELQKLNVAIFCHFPLLPLTSHCLWNSEELIKLLDEFSCVKIYLNGHNHNGNYEFKNSIYYLTLKAMVTSPNENSFAVITLKNNAIEVDGYGREDDRKLLFN